MIYFNKLYRLKTAYIVKKEVKGEGGKGIMYCKKCGKKLEENERYCSACGEPVDMQEMDKTDNREQENSQMGKDRLQRKNDDNRRFAHNSTADHPTKALIVEGIGILFFIYMLIVNGSGDASDLHWLEENGPGVFFIGLIFIVVSHFMMKKYKKNYRLYGIGYVGYIVSCIAVVLLIVLLLLSIFMVIPVMLR